MSSLAVVGRERRIVRGPGESAPAYAERVRQWRPAHRHRGSVYALLDQWNAYNVTRRAIDVLYHSGTLYKLYEAESPVERSIIFWDAARRHRSMGAGVVLSLRGRRPRNALR